MAGAGRNNKDVDALWQEYTKKKNSMSLEELARLMADRHRRACERVWKSVRIFGVAARD